MPSPVPTLVSISAATGAMAGRTRRYEKRRAHA